MFDAFLDCLYGSGPAWAITGTQDRSRLVNLREYIDRPHELGEYYVPGIQQEEWLVQCREQSTVPVADLARYWDNGIPAVARSSAFCDPQQCPVFVFEHDTLIVPSKNECKALGGISEDELKALQPQVIYQAAMATGMPHSAMVWSGSKSLHTYLIPEDPSEWPERPPLLGGTKGLPQMLVDRIRARTRHKSEAERGGRYARWHAWMYLEYLATGKFDYQVALAAGQGGYVRTPGAIRGNGNRQEIWSFKGKVRFVDRWNWLLGQVNQEVRDWVDHLGRTQNLKPLNKAHELRDMLRIDVAGGWKDMVVRRVHQGGELADEQALTKQVMAVVAELYPTQRGPEIRRRPNLEEGDWGEIHASFLWWVSFLTMNHLSIPYTSQHPQAPTPVGWVFTGDPWWWEDGNGREHNIREIWKPGNSGSATEKLQEIKENEHFYKLTENIEEQNEAIAEWIKSGFKDKKKPSFMSDVVAASIAGAAPNLTQMTKEELRNRKQAFSHYFNDHVLRLTENNVPYSAAWMAFNGKTWETVSSEEILRGARFALEQFPTFNNKGEPQEVTVQAMKDLPILIYTDTTDNYILDKRREWHQDEECIVFPNGTMYLDQQTGEVDWRPQYWNPDDWAVACMPSNYDPAMETPVFDNYMETSFPDPHDREIVLQYLGYLLSPTNKEKKWLCLIGESDSGKTTLQTLMTHIVGGREFVMTPALDSMAKDNFWAAEIPKSRLITIDEKTEVTVQMRKQITATIKQVTGDGFVNVRQMRKESFTYPVKAKLVLSANNLPDLVDESEATWKRAILINPTVPEKKNKFISEQMEAELPGIMPKIVAALGRMIRNGGFILSPEQQSRLDNYRKANSPLLEFFDDWMLPEKDTKCYLRSVMEVFNRVRGANFKSENKFYNALRVSFPQMKISRLVKDAILAADVKHAPGEKHLPNSAYIITGWYCTHELASINLGAVDTPLEQRGTLQDKTPPPSIKIPVRA